MKNNTSYKRTVRMLAAFLTVTTLVVSLPLTAFAQRQTDGTQTLSQDEVPDFMELDELLEQGMTDRIYESDDLYSYIFENADGERTLYRYSVPVRYVDEYGVVRDKSTDIAEYTDGSFRTVASDILTVFGERIADGICLSDSDYALMLTPVAANDALAFLSADSKTVTYMIDEHTRYEYSLTAMGFKEDIIVESYTGQTEYEFDLDTNGLALVDQFGTYVLADEDGTVCGSLSDIIIFTADERNNTYGEMSVETVVENEQYRLTVRLDDAWLSDANTAYPITIDPSITLTASGDIEDIVVGTSTTYSADSGSLYVGRGSSGAKLRTLMRFPGLNIDGYYVTEAVVTLRDLMCQDVAQTVECHKFTGNSWSESSGTSWSGVGNDMVGSLLSTQVVSYSNGVDSMHASVHRYEFDITSLARQWAAGTCSPESGILFKATDDYEVNGTKTFKTFASINRSSNNPTLYIRYSKALGVNGSYTYSTQTLDNNVSGSVSHSMGNLNSVYSFDIYDSDFPLEVAYVFNSNLVGQQYLSYYGYNYSTYFGYGWKLSLYELLFKDSTANAYIYVDSYGTEYSFPYDAETGLYTNDGLDLSVTIDDTSLKLNPGDGITRTFNSDGFVSSIEMDDEVYTYVYDSTSNYRLTAITDESGDTDLSFTYNSTGFLTGVDGKYTISYGSSRVSSIADNYSNIHTYSYGSTYFNVRNDDTLYGYYYTLSSATMQVSVIRNYRSSTTYVLERDDITYAENKTTYANSLCDYLSVYHFDDEGRTVNALRTSEDGTTIYYAEAYAYEPAYDTTGTYFFSGGMPFNRSNYVNSSNYVYSSFYQGSKTLNSGAQNSITSSVNCHKVLYLTGLLQLGSAVGQDDTVLTIELIYSNTTFGSDILTFPVNNLITDQQYFCYEIYPKESVASVIVTFYNPATASTSFQYVSLVGGDSLADSSTEEESTATRYSSGLSYTVLTSKTCSITGIGSCTDTDLVIPEYMGGKYKVTQIAGEAFKNNTSVTSVLLPDTVKRIGNKAFYGCSSLQTIDLSYELTYIGADAFRNCTSLTSIDIPNKVTFVGDHAFNSCESLSEVSLSNGLTELTEYVFSECYDITYINMPKSIKTLGVGAFYHIDNLKVYYEGTSAEWNAVTKGTAALTSTSTVYAQSEYYDNFRYTYTTDQNGNITSTTITYVGDEETSDTVRFTSATYDANGNLLSYTDERGNTTSYTYDEYGNTTSVTDAKGTTTYYTYTKGVLTGIWQESGIHIYYDYTNGLLTAIRVIKGSDYSQSYNFTYNSFGKLTQVSLNTSPYIRYTYQNGGAGALTGVTYQNSDYEQYTYDMMGNVSSVKVNGTTRYTYVYDYMGNLLSGSDVQTTIVDTCKYDRLGTMVSRTQTVNGTTVYTIDEDGSYTFADGAVTPDVGSEESYDVWDRITSSALTLTVDETTNTVYTVAYTYLASANSMTDFIGTESFSNGSAFSYTYDANSNLTSVKENGILKISYTYDSNNQLIREDNANSGKTTVWTYDANGNILSGEIYAYTTGTVGTLSEAVAYAYGNSSCADLLTSYNGGTITYDAAFLPQNWRNASSLSWEGRNLTSLTLTDGPTITYAYDGNGIRTSKSVGTDTVQYVRDGSKLLQEIHADYTITFLYDDTDTLIGFRYGGNNYYYGADSLGVIHYVYNEAGTVVVTYTYDAWGGTVSATGNNTLIGVNPIRYKSYYYDSETGFFYLQSRYYDPQVGRFVSADDWQYMGATGTVLGYNLFSYCENEPVNYVDNIGLVRTKISTSQYNNKYWLVKLISKYIPNIYSGDLVAKTLLNKRFLGVGIEISVSVAAQTNANAIYGGMFAKGVIEISAFWGITDKLCFAFSPGITWKETYMKLGLLYSPTSSGLYYALTLKISVSHLTAAAIAVSCVAMPYLGTFVSSVLVAVKSSISSAATILVPMLPKLIPMLI